MPAMTEHPAEPSAGTSSSSSPPQPSPAVPADASATLCPRCGYYLRGSASGRCSECGLEVDAAGLAVSAVPWAHCHKLGRVRSYFRTAWQITWDAKRLRYELSRPQDARSVRAFRWWTAATLAVAFAVAAAVPLLAARDAEEVRVALAVQPSGAVPGVPGLTIGSGFGGPPGGGPTWAEGPWQDLSVPWSSGATLWPVLPACGLLLATYLAGTPRAAIRVGRLPPDRRAAADALGSYAAGPLALLLPAQAIAGLAALAAVWSRDVLSDPFAQLAGRLAIFVVSLVGGLLAVAGIVATVIRTGQWAARSAHGSAVAHGGFGRTVLGSAELLARWAVGAAVLLGVVPWCVGLIWTMLDALR